MGSTERKQQFVFVQIWKMVTIRQRQTSDERDQSLVHPMDPMSNRGTGQDRDKIFERVASEHFHSASLRV